MMPDPPQGLLSFLYRKKTFVCSGIDTHLDYPYSSRGPLSGGGNRCGQ